MQFANEKGRVVVERLIDTIRENRTFLSEVDGAIGDGDHGVNMAKGFTLTAERLTDEMDLAESLRTLGRTLVMEIGGVMGPLYGSFFKAMAKAAQGRALIDAEVFEQMLCAALAAVTELGNAQVGDKSLVDSLSPAVESFKSARSEGVSFGEALRRMAEAAERGKESTRELVAKVGRASRLGERSRGVLDAGAASCYLILSTLAESIEELLG
jgi:dihydroxyacetone kinase-like protein